MTTDLRLRPLTADDEAEFLRAHRTLAQENTSFAHGWRSGLTWPEYLAMLERTRLGIDLPAHRVPATFLVADVKGVIVGRTSIRHTLNDELRQIGGHIGYAVLPDYRRCGYGSEILWQSLHRPRPWHRQRAGDMRRRQHRIRQDHRGVRRRPRIADTTCSPLLDRLNAISDDHIARERSSHVP